MPIGTRERLIASTEALIETLPYDAISVSSIAAKCGVSRQVFYKYFQTKEDIFQQISCRYVRRGLKMEGCFTWRELVMHCLTEQTRHRDFFMRVARAKDPFVAFRSQYDTTLDFLRTILAQSAPTPLDNDIDTILQMYCLGCITQLIGWQRAGMPQSPEWLARIFELSMPSPIHDLLVGEKNGPLVFNLMPLAS